MLKFNKNIAYLLTSLTLGSNISCHKFLKSREYEEAQLKCAVEPSKLDEYIFYELNDENNEKILEVDKLDIIFFDNNRNPIHLDEPEKTHYTTNNSCLGIKKKSNAKFLLIYDSKNNLGYSHNINHEENNIPILKINTESSKSMLELKIACNNQHLNENNALFLKLIPNRKTDKTIFFRTNLTEKEEVDPQTSQCIMLENKHDYISFYEEQNKLAHFVMPSNTGNIKIYYLDLREYKKTCDHSLEYNLRYKWENYSCRPKKYEDYLSDENSNSLIFNQILNEIENTCSNFESIQDCNNLSSNALEIHPLIGLNFKKIKIKNILFSDTSAFEYLKSVTFLDLSYTNTKDLIPLMNLSSLSHLTLSNTKISSISHLRNSIELKSLNLSNTNISDISPLKNLINLESLNLSHIKTNDFSILKHLINLSTLVLSYTNISDLSFISKLTQLKHLYIDHTNISDISSLKELTKLKKIVANKNNITDIHPLKQLIQLNHLELNENDINDISSLENLLNLTFLDLNNTEIENLNALQQLRKLKMLDCDQTRIRSLSPIKDFDKLEELSLNDTPIDDISPLDNCLELKYLHLNKTNVHNLNPLSRLTNMQWLYLDSSSVTDLSPIATLSDLEALFINETRIESIEAVLNLEKLFRIEMHGSPIKNKHLLSALDNLVVIED